MSGCFCSGVLLASSAKSSSDWSLFASIGPGATALTLIRGLYS